MMSSSIKVPSPLSPTIFGWSLQSKGMANSALRRGKRQSSLVCANANGRRARRTSSDRVIMVDPLEAKRLAAKEMQEIRAKEKFRRRRLIEANNGAWAMIGLTAGLVVEGQTGKGILAQLAGYCAAVGSFIFR